ncbi:hypothetical protein RCL1_004915 [Eukaryota sp. TZLM3-RCL]
MTIVLGIDLGTTFSCAYVYDSIDGFVLLLLFITFLLLSIFMVKQPYLGAPAFAQIPDDPQNVVFEIKRLIGKSFDSPSVSTDASRWPFIVQKDSNNNPVINVSFDGVNKSYLPQQISAFVLIELKQLAEEVVGEQINDVVITVPAYFNDAQRNATKQAGQLAGLNVLRVVTEPVAAALAYRHNLTNLSTERTIIVFDLGGGTFDISLVKLTENSVTVIATAGDNHLGGVDFDQVLFNHFMTEAVRQFGIGVQNDIRAKARLRTECEQVKKRLSNVPQTRLMIFGFYDGTDFSSPIFQSTFEQLCAPLFNSCMLLVDRVLSESQTDPSQVDDVLLVGGSTRIPKIRQLLSDKFGKKKINAKANADEIVAQGAAIQAFLCIEGNEPSLDGRDVFAQSLGYQNDNHVSNHSRAVVQDCTSHSLGTDYVAGTSSENYHTFMILDTSGSTDSTAVVPQSDWVLQKNLLGSVVESVFKFTQSRASTSTQDLISIIQFSSKASVICEGVSIGDSATIQKHLNKLQPYGGTYFSRALDCAFQSWGRQHQTSSHLVPLFVLLSDGQDFSPENQVVKTIECQFLDFPQSIIHTIGFGNEDFERLEHIARLGRGTFHLSVDNISLQSAFRGIALAPARLRTKSHKTALLIPKHTPIPVRKTLHCTNAYDNESEVTITVLEGEAELAVENTLLSEFSVQISPKPAGKAEIEVEFEIDSDGILQVSAREVGTQGRREIVSRRPGFLNPTELVAARREMSLVTSVNELSVVRQKLKEMLSHSLGTLSPEAIDHCKSALKDIASCLTSIDHSTSDVNEILEKVCTYRQLLV